MTKDVPLFNSESSAGVVIKLTGSCSDDQSNISAASVSQDVVDETALDDNY